MKSNSKILNRYLPLFLSVLLLVVGALFVLYSKPDSNVADAAWYSSSWGYRKPLTIDKNKLSTTATTTFSNFPMLFSVTDSDLKYTSYGGKVGKTDGTDIVFTSSDGTTKLDHEIEKYSSSTGETIIWVRIPTLSAAADTTLYIYFGNSGASDQQNRTGVWDSNYKGVYHLPNGTTLSTTDSTGQNNGTNNGASANSAQIDGGGSFDGSSAYIQASTSPIVAGTSSFTISAWIRTTSQGTTNGKSIYAERAASGNDIVKLDSTDLGSPNGVHMTYRNSAGSLTQVRGPSIINDNKLHYVVGTLSAGVLSVYVDGKLDSSAARNGNDTLTDAGKRAWIGGDYQDGIAYFNGTIDDVRVLSTARSLDWIATEYNNQNSPNTFYAYGSVGIERRTAAGGKVTDRGSSGSSWYSSSWGYRKPLTIDKNKLSTTATTTFSNFPMLFSVTDSDLKYTSYGGKVGKTDGTDIVFTSSDGTTKLDHEIEKYSSSTGETIIWVRIPTLSAAADTTLYIYFGNSGASDQQNRTGVWNLSYRIVQHHASTTGTTLIDSTSNALSGSKVSSTSPAPSTSGQIDGAQSFNGSSDMVTTNDTNNPTAYTMSAWVRPSTLSSMSIFLRTDNSGPTTAWSHQIRMTSSGNFQAYTFDGGAATLTGATKSESNQWYYITATAINSGEMRLYVNGVLDAVPYSPVGTLWTGGNKWLTGSNSSGFSYWNGIIDEVRLSTSVNSADWIATEYNNQNSPNTFYAYGALSTINRQNSSGASAPTIKVRGGVKFR